MIRAREGMVIDILTEREDLQEISVDTEDSISRAIVYKNLTGPVNKGDRVLLNTTAEYLGLGTGGYHFVIVNYNNRTYDLTGPGHIMKLRYTPMQIKCLAIEEPQSDHHGEINDFNGLGNKPVITIPLHSMLAPLCATIKNEWPDTRIGYVMTDTAALPIGLSKMVAILKGIGLVDVTITSGNAFGGDFEAVNFYTGIIAAARVAGCDLVIVGPGPGVVGTGTAYGFSSIEQGYIIDGIHTLDGIALAAVRISFADNRIRHKGISHHSLRVLGNITKTKAIVPLPNLNKEKADYIEKQVRDSGVINKHTIMFSKGDKVFNAMERYNLKVTTMGRGPGEDRDFFLSIGAAAMIVGEGYL